MIALIRGGHVRTTPLSLPSGTIDVFDSGGGGTPIVFGHGLVMDHTLWGGVIGHLGSEFRCVVPVLPLGGHRRPMPTGSDLSMAGIARLVAETLDAMGLGRVVLVSNDWGGMQITAVERPDLVAGLVLSAQEAFDNVPPGLPGRFAVATCRLPGGLRGAAWGLRLPGVQRLPMTFGRMTVRPISSEMLRSWTQGLLADAAIARDVRAYVATTPRDCLINTAEQLRDFDRPTLVMWTTDDRTVPRSHGRRLADLVPGARLIEYGDCSVLMPLDQPYRMAEDLRAFARSL